MSETTHTTGPNDPRFTTGSGFLEIVGLASAVGTIGGYAAIWETIGLYKSGAFLPPAALLKIIQQAGIMPHAYAAPLAIGAAGGLIAGAALGWKLGDIPGEIHVRGSRLTRKAKVLQRAILRASPPIKGKNEGIRIHPQIQLTEHLEASHALIVGGAGAGKTTILWPIVQQVIDRGDRAIVFSFKGDFEQKIGTQKQIGRQFALLAPWDSRSAVWAVGRDIRTRLDAEALASTLIPEAPGTKSDPMWTQGSRSLLVGIISDVQREHGENWGFAELAKRSAEALSDFATLKKIIERESPQAYALISGGASSKTTASFLATISSYLTQVINLGVAADCLKTQAGGKQWSVNRWLTSDNIPPIAVLGFRPSAKQLSQAWGSSIIEQVVLKLSDLPDVSPDHRRVWLILDEVPKLGQVPSITDALETLRSKGVRVVLGAQGIDQIEETYSKNIARSWATQTAIKVIGRITEPESQKWASSLIGERELERFSSQYNVQSGGNGHGSGSTSGGGYQRTKESVVLPGEFGSIVSVTKTGPRAILHVAGSDHVGLLDWPFASQQVIRSGRDQHPAPWVLPRYDRPTWGTTPPKVATPPQIADGQPKKEEDQPDKKAAQLDSVQPDQGQNNSDNGVGGDGVGGVIADQAVDSMLDAVVPGAGMLHSMLSMLDSDAGGSAAVVIRQAQRQEDRGDLAESGSDAESDAAADEEAESE